MVGIRPGTKVKMWSPRFKNRPEAEPPGLLKLAGALSLLSVIGVILYAVAQSVSGIGGSETRGTAAAYLALLHFVLPFVIFYTISANSPLSRLAIGAYVLILGSATILGKGFLGALPFDQNYKAAIAAIVILLVLFWLYRSAKMRFYYAIISNKPIHADLAARATELHGGNWLSQRARESLAWFLDHMETIVLVGFIFTAIYAFVSTS